MIAFFIKRVILKVPILLQAFVKIEVTSILYPLTYWYHSTLFSKSKDIKHALLFVRKELLNIFNCSILQVQRLVTPIMLQRKRQRMAVKRKRAEKNRQAAAEYAKILAQRQKEAKEAKELRRKRSASLRESRNSVKSS